MNVIQRYLFRRLFGAFALAFPALTIVIWLSQALRELSLITERGQNVGVFFEAIILFLPGLITIIAPVSLLLVVISTVNSLNNDSELVSVAASGSSQRVMLRPILVLAIPVALLSAVCSLFLAPAAQSETASLLEEVNADVIGALLRPGQFRSLGDDVTIQVAAIRPDGTLQGIFIFDEREAGETAAYLAGAGATYRADDGSYLLMQDGMLQRRLANGDITVLRFESYAFSLSDLAARTEGGRTTPQQRSLAYLLDPDPNDPIYQDRPFSFTAELHNRIIIPLYVIVLAVVPLAMLGQAHSMRQRRAALTIGTTLFGIALIGIGITLSQALSQAPVLLPLSYAIPLGLIVLSMFAILSGRKMPTFGFGRLGQLLYFRRRTKASAHS